MGLFRVSLIVLSLLVAFSALADVKEEVQTVIKKVNEAIQKAKTDKDASIADFQSNKNWNWGTSYIFVINCKTNITLAHPMVPALVGKPTSEIKDKNGVQFFKKFCEESLGKKQGGWVEYVWPKPGSSEPVRKVSLTKHVEGTDYDIGAGIYDEKKEMTIEALDKMLK